MTKFLILPSYKAEEQHKTQQLCDCTTIGTVLRTHTVTILENGIMQTQKDETILIGVKNST